MPTPTPTPTAVVTTFLARWEQPGGLDAAFRDYFTADTVWENVGLAVTTGPEEAMAFNAQVGAALNLAAIRIDNLAIAEAEGKVLTERIDHMVAADGTVIASVPVMGIFEVAGGKIIAWRDYFDSAGAAAMMQGEKT